MRPAGGFVVPFQRIADAVMTNARFLEQALVATGHFDILNDTRYLPVVVVRLRPGHAFDCFQIADELRKFGWTAPAYALPPAAQDTVVLSLVVKENFSRELAEKLLRDIDSCLRTLEQRGAVGAAGGAEQAAPHGVADPEYGRPHAQAAAPAAGGTERRIPSDPCGYSDS